MVDQATKAMRLRFAKVGFVLTAILGLGAIVLIWLFSSSSLVLIAVRGDSMAPTLRDGQSIILKQAETFADSLIVVFPKPDAWGANETTPPELIKRIIASPGDVLSYENDELLVNGELMFSLAEENYDCSLQEGYTHKLSSAEFFAMGDNHTVSLDSLRILCDADAPNSDAYVSVASAVAYGTIERVI